MNIIVCIDDGGGILFNKRRQSSDKALIRRVLEQSVNSRLLMNEYSAKLFEGENVLVDNFFLSNAKEGDFCFVENEDVTDYLNKIKKVYLYRWNRKYPSDFKFNMDIIKDFKLISTENFVGNSHPEITEEIYEV